MTSKRQQDYERRVAFKARLETLGLKSTSKAAEALGVSRYAIMHWRSGRRAIPPIADAALDGVMMKKFWEFYGP